eukprot:1134256-Rhodomonas_salina.1
MSAGTRVQSCDSTGKRTEISQNRTPQAKSPQNFHWTLKYGIKTIAILQHITNPSMVQKELEQWRGLNIDIAVPLPKRHCNTKSWIQYCATKSCIGLCKFAIVVMLSTRHSTYLSAMPRHHELPLEKSCA